jgi:hypothetical protein
MGHAKAASVAGTLSTAQPLVVPATTDVAWLSANLVNFRRPATPESLLHATARSSPPAFVQPADLIPRDAIVCRGVPRNPKDGIMRERIVSLLGLTSSLTTLIC